MKFFRSLIKKLNRSRGQAVVEYGLILILVILATGAIIQTKTSTENVLKSSVGRNGVRAENPTTISTPKAPDKKEIWDHGSSTVNQGYKLSPTAYFSIPNPVYVGEKINYWDTSYDVDGQIVERTWAGKIDTFTSEGTYTISLTVKDNDDLTDTYTVKVKVEKRKNYTKLVYDHKNESRTVLSESSIRNDGVATTRILDHIYGERTDLYSIKHVVIEKNYYETVQNRVKDITYEVTVPILLVTFDGQGREISREPYLVDGEPQYVVQTEVKTVPQPADYKTEWRDNKWTFYVYNEISSVQSPTNSWGARGPSVDYPRFDPEEKKTRQDPGWESSRTSKKTSNYNAGYAAPSTPCKTCTIPNEFTRQSTSQSLENTLTCNGYDYSKTTHTRTYNYIDHAAYDTIYKYSGTSNGSNPTDTTKLLRHTWKTEGWQTSEQSGGTAIERAKYTNCTGSGESCWQPQTNSAYPVDGWVLYDTKVATYTKKENNVEYEKKIYTYYYKRNEYACTWSGTTKTSDTTSEGKTTGTYDTGWYVK